MAEKLLTIRDVAQKLGVNESEVVKLAESGQLPAYKVGGVYLRFKKEQVEAYMKYARISDKQRLTLNEYPFRDRLADFFYFNDFYILAGIIILIMLAVIFKGS
ncbi:MAG: helix-turn-helix domain-containing protein [Candidatus Omnitrophica bacterium]|nr:helix-turn-helix domain-containing protein [Candidatus Omnitrophota bacterium]MDD5236507.1 helix-turn-helix domain-containing protein [Candidatus Omnitrophota bacterium]MDD5610394.1 helix-turn-helix domain-containing protein [Candidatus Omnitrophota bacterium]